MIFYIDLKLSNLRDSQAKITESLNEKTICNGCKKKPEDCICCAYTKGEVGEPPYIEY